MLENAVVESAFLSGDCPEPGVRYALLPEAVVGLPLPGLCTAVTHDEVLQQYVSVYRLKLTEEKNSVGLIMKEGTVVYLRLHSDMPPNASAGVTYKAGHPLVFPSPRPQRVTLALRVGGKDGIYAWDQGVVRAVLDHPLRRGYGYPTHPHYLRRAVALRFVDPATFGLAAPYPDRLL